MIRPLKSQPEITRRGFTLVELLVTIGIIGILASMVGMVAVGAGASSRESKTVSMVTRIDGLVVDRYESYRSRRAPVVVAAEEAIRRSSGNRSVAGRQIAQLRLLAKRELMKMEMPDRWTDFLLAPMPGETGDPASVTPGAPQYLRPGSSGAPTPLVSAYRRQYFAIASLTNKITGDRNTVADIINNQSAECLYMIVMFSTADGEARSLFNDSNIGDVDGDGANEFLDGWGNPIHFMRWPCGFNSDLQLSVSRIRSMDSSAAVAAIAADPDPFDLFRVDQSHDGDVVAARGFRLMPLVYSGGADGDPDLTTNRDLDFDANFVKQVDPYLAVAGRRFWGEPNDDNDGDNWTDNIHNHNLATK